MTDWLRARLRRLAREDGTTLIETTVASGILVIMLVGLLSMGSIAAVNTENQGHLSARTTEYAQDKMEQLLALAYSDTTSSTVVFPAASSGGTGLAVGGSADTSAPASGYVDWLGEDGGLLGGGTSAPADWAYERVWAITCVTSPCTPNPATGVNRGVKQLVVTVRTKTALGGQLAPKSTIVALKAGQF
jgi:hypothetical protein